MFFFYNSQKIAGARKKEIIKLSNGCVNNEYPVIDTSIIIW